MGRRGKSREHDRLGAQRRPEGQTVGCKLSGWYGVIYAATAGQHSALPSLVGLPLDGAFQLKYSLSDCTVFCMAALSGQLPTWEVRVCVGEP